MASKTHLFWFTLILTLFFTYAGVEESLLESFSDLDFRINLVINGIQIYLLFYLTYFLHFNKGFKFLRSLLISLGVFYLLQVFQIFIIDYEPDDFTELYSITLPFGSLIIFGVNFYYFKYKETKALKLNIETPKPESFWLPTPQGKKSVKFNNFRYASLNEINLKLFLTDKELVSFISLKELETLISEELDIFRLNKQHIASKAGISSFKSLKDGRLQVVLFGELQTIISKNKAANFKQWIDKG